MAATTSGGSALVTMLLIVLWYATSMLAITTSKMTMEMLKVPLTLCAAQFLSATTIAGSVLRLTGGSCKVGRDSLAMLGCTAVTYASGFFFTNLAFSLANAAFVETVKAAEPISTVVLALTMLGEHERAATYASLLPVVLGVGMASSGEAGGSLAAFLATAASNFGFSARAVFAKRLKRECPREPVARCDVSLFFHISWMGVLVFIPMAAFKEGPALQAAAATEGFDLSRFIAVVAVNGLMYTAYNQFSFMVLSRVSTASHAVLNVCRRVCVIGVTTVVFGTPLAATNMIGVVIAVAGMMWFTHAKTAKVQPVEGKKHA